MTLAFQLYARDPDGRRHVEYIECPPKEVVARARRLLSETHVAEVEVRMGAHYMFTVDRDMVQHVA